MLRKRPALKATRKSAPPRNGEIRGHARADGGADQKAMLPAPRLEERYFSAFPGDPASSSASPLQATIRTGTDVSKLS